MNGYRKDICFTVVDASQEYAVATHANEYRNLMVLLNNMIYLENFGDCGGQGRCATCLISISGPRLKTAGLERNERSTLDKKGLTQTGIRLACQLLITEELHGAVVTIVADLI